MNFLAHLWLADTLGARPSGALLGDQVRGRLDPRWPADLRASIQLHRRIDALTDAHPVVRQISAQFVQGKRRYAGILLDVLWDHALAGHWLDYGKEVLAEFCQRISVAVGNDAEAYELAGLPCPPSARLEKLLASYQRPEAIDRALAQIGSRLRQPQHFTPLIDGWREVWPAVEAAHPVLLRGLLLELQADWPAIVADQSAIASGEAAPQPSID